jgi:hypothetical protein
LEKERKDKFRYSQMPELRLWLRTYTY